MCVQATGKHSKVLLAGSATKPAEQRLQTTSSSLIFPYLFETCHSHAQQANLVESPIAGHCTILELWEMLITRSLGDHRSDMQWLCPNGKRTRDPNNSFPTRESQHYKRKTYDFTWLLDTKREYPELFQAVRKLKMLLAWDGDLSYHALWEMLGKSANHSRSPCMM